MADVTTYKRCTTTYFYAGAQVQLGEVRLATDAVVVANPGYWVALTDAELSGGARTRFH